MIEEWRDIKGYKGLYQVSNLGRVKSLGAHKNRPNEKILKPIKRKKESNYVAVNLFKNKKIKMFFIHRLVADAFLDKKNGKPEINHIDHNPKNNAVSNLEYVDRDENLRCYYNKHRLYKGFISKKSGSNKYTVKMIVYGFQIYGESFLNKEDAQKSFSASYFEWWGEKPKLLPLED